MKIGPLTVIILGLSIGLSVLGYAFFQHFVPNQKETELLVASRDQNMAVAKKRGQAEARVQQAVTLATAKVGEWRQIVALRTPPPSLAGGGINLAVNGWQLAIDVPRFRNSVQAAVNTQLKAGGVKVIQGPRVPDPPNDPNGILAGYFNYPAIQFPVVIFDLGEVAVQGTYKQISDHVRAWSRMPRYLAVTDRLRLEGTSPNLTGRYNLSLIGFIRANQVFPPVPQGGGQAAGAAGARAALGNIPPEVLRNLPPDAFPDGVPPVPGQ